jgi:serine/threonine protein kinase
MSVAIFPSDDDDPQHLPGYEILDEVGRGGLAVVFRARQRSSNRIVALRTTRTEVGDQQTARSLLWEADLLARLQHPHVVSILDRFEYAGRVFLVLEYIEGGTLAARLTGEPQPARPAATLVERLARTLAWIHQRGIIHCNLKPRKVQLAAVPATPPPGRPDSWDCEEVYGIPLISGFELALDRQRLAELQVGEVRGTPAYMAPEQARAQHQAIGPATDIYALGVILFEMLTGRTPFVAETAIELLRQAIDGEPIAVRTLNPAVDRKLEAICHKCLHKDPAQRYADGLELAAALRGFVNQLSKRWWF